MTADELNAHKIRCFARFCWKHRNELAPNLENGQRYTWVDIFERRTKISLTDYAQRQKDTASRDAETDKAEA